MVNPALLNSIVSTALGPAKSFTIEATSVSYARTYWAEGGNYILILGKPCQLNLLLSLDLPQKHKTWLNLPRLFPLHICPELQ